MASGNPLLHDMKGIQFPFGVLSVEGQEIKKMLVRKKYIFKDQQQQESLRMKIEKLKNVTHRNTINLRNSEENVNSITLYYQYVPYSLEDSFQQNPAQSVKELHRQFIQLAIYLAKNCITTTFNPQRCGVIINDNVSTIKYYLPLPEISLTDNRTTLERAVQLFNVQSMHYLDTLISQALNTTVNESFSQRTFKNRVKLFHGKQRRDSQPTGILVEKDRKFSNIPQKQDQKRKLSSLSRQLSQISEIHKKNRASTRVSAGSLNTYQSIQSFKSQKEANLIERRDQNTDQNSKLLKRCHSDNGFEAMQVKIMINRSKKALQNLKNIRGNMNSFKQFYEVIKKLQKG